MKKKILIGVTVSSLWKSPGVLAHAQKFIGTGTVETYWNCR